MLSAKKGCRSPTPTLRIMEPKPSTVPTRVSVVMIGPRTSAQVASPGRMNMISGTTQTGETFSR